MVPPATQDAKLISDLYNLIFIFAVIVFVLVEGLLIYSAVKFRRKNEGEMPVQVHGSRTFELLWTIVPAIVIAIIFGFAVDTMSKLSATGSLAVPVAHTHRINDVEARRRVESAEPVDLVIEVVGRQWVWQYKYPGNEGVIGNEELVVPVGKTVRLDMTAADVIHAWWMPELGPMIYVNPGELSYVWFNIDNPGLYVGQCNVYCGAAHANMLSRVKALPQAEFDQWYAEQANQNAGPLQPGDPARGRNIIETGACAACHSVAGTKAQGKVAPRALTVFATYPTIAQVEGFTNAPENLRKWLQNPQEVKPGTAMPNLNLKPQEIEDLVAYLETLK
jgi:cytochrome c oxidase subunit 2